MSIFHRFIHIFSAFIILSQLCYAQKQIDVEFVITYKIRNVKQTNRSILISLIPNDLKNRQKINNILFSIEPDSIYFHGENKYAEFRMNKPIPDSLSIICDISFYKNDYETMSNLEKIVKSDDTVLKKYLSNGRYIDSNHSDIIEQVGKLKAEKEINSVRNIYNFVTSHIKYSSYLPKAQGSIVTLQNGRGSCADFSHLMVALCRANSIPARAVYGIAGSKTKHHWVEVYLENVGWTTFEPTPGNNANFETTNMIYINLCPDEDLSEKLADYYFYWFQWFGNRSDLRPDIKASYYIKKHLN